MLQPRQLNAGLVRQANVNQQTQRVVQNIHPIRPQQQYRPQGQLHQPQQQQSRFAAPVLQRVGTVNARMTQPNAPALSVTKKAVSVQPKLATIQSNIKPQPQYVTETKSSSTSTDINELDDLENSITAAKIHKTPPEPPPHTATPTQNIGTNQYVIQSQQPNIQACQTKPNFQNQRPNNAQTIQQPYIHNPSSDDSRKVVTLRSGESMPLTEYKRQYVLPQQQLQNLNQSQPGQAVIRGNSGRGRGAMRGGGTSGQVRFAKKPYSTIRPPANQQLQQQQQQQSQQNQTDQSQHIIETEARESAKMLVVLQSGEQRLITFTLPKESCTVQELLEQVGVPFTDHTNIECVTNPGVSIDYLVTVGVTCSGYVFFFFFCYYVT